MLFTLTTLKNVDKTASDAATNKTSEQKKRIFSHKKPFSQLLKVRDGAIKFDYAFVIFVNFGVQIIIIIIIISLN